MKGASTGGRARPSTPSAAPQRRSSFHVSTDHSHPQSADTLSRIVFKDLDDINPNPNRTCSLHLRDSSSYASQQRRFSTPHRPAVGSNICGDRGLGRFPTLPASNVGGAMSSISADLVRRTQGDAADNGHPFGVQQQQRRFSSPAAFPSSRAACCTSSSSSTSSSSLLYRNTNRSSAAAALKSSVLHSARKLSLQRKLASGSEHRPHIGQCNDAYVNDPPVLNICAATSTDPLPSSSDDILESRLHRMTLRSGSRAAREAAAASAHTRCDSFTEYEDAYVFREGKCAVNAVDSGEIDPNPDDGVAHVDSGEVWRQNEAMLTIAPPRGLSCLVGLYNEGNTCYLNSCIQCLAHTMPLAMAMLGGNVDLSPNREETDCGGSRRLSLKRASNSSVQEYGRELCTRRLNEANCVAREFRHLLTRMWSSACPPYSVVSAGAFLRSVQAWDLQFSGYQQQDAQEAMRAILDGLHESLNRVKNRRYMDIYREYGSRREDELAAITWNYQKSLNDSLIQDVFCGQLQSSIECSVCKRTSHCFDPFLDLSLPLPEHGGSLLGARFSNKRRISILDCLASFVAPETLSGHDKYKCATCKIPQLSTKKLSIYRLPPILVLHLKRFHGSAPLSFRKNDTPVSYPLRGLDLEEFLGVTPQKQYPHGALYDLYAVCHHSGSIGYGHYTAQCKDADGLWYTFNDLSVSTSNESSIVSSSAYILFYQQRHP